MTSSLSTADYYSDYVSVMMKTYNKSACDGEYLRIDCPEGTSIHIQRAMYGRKVPSSEMCPSQEMEETGSGSPEEENTDCEAKTGAECQDKRICQLLVHRRVFGEDPCPGTNKYLTVQYKCAPKDFQEQSTCSMQNIRLRCRQDTVISVFNVKLTNKTNCIRRTNQTKCTMTKPAILKDISKKCHSKEKCFYSLPSAACFNHAKIVHTCVPKQFLTSELPSSVELLTTTSSPTTQSTNYYTTDKLTVKPTVTSIFENKGDSSIISSSTSLNFKEDATPDYSAKINTENQTIFTANLHDVTSAVDNLTLAISRKTKDDTDDVIIHNDFPMLQENTMEKNSTNCLNCSSGSSGSVYNIMLEFYNYLKENTDDIIIAVLLGVVAALLLVVCILVFPCKKKLTKEKLTKAEQGTELTVEDNRQNSTEVYTVAEPPVEEDEHENMSLLGSILQRSMSSANNTVQRQHIGPNTSRVTSCSKIKEKEETNCGLMSIFAKICCTCCCNNAPWQRTRHRGDVYRVTHRYSSSIEDEDITGRFRSRETFPVFSRTDDNVDNRSPIPILEDHVNRTEYPIVTSSAPLTSSSQQNSNFRPISRNANRQYSLTPEPDMTRRTNHSFRPTVRLESQRSDPALNIYSVHHQHNVTQPQTAPTSPIIKHHGNHSLQNGIRDPSRTRLVSTPKSPQMGPSFTQNSQLVNSVHGASAAPTLSPMTPKYTPPPSHLYSTQQYPSFTEAYEQYDNAQQQIDVAVRRKQYQRPREHNNIPNQYSHPQYNTNNGQYHGYYPQNGYGDHYVQAVPRRTVPSNARTVDLAANARTVDLAHNNSLSRNSWLEIRRSSIYDNSLPRNSEMYDYYQNEMQQAAIHHQTHNELPGSRNLNQYY